MLKLRAAISALAIAGLFSGYLLYETNFFTLEPTVQTQGSFVTDSDDSDLLIQQLSQLAEKFDRREIQEQKQLEILQEDQRRLIEMLEGFDNRLSVLEANRDMFEQEQFSAVESESREAKLSLGDRLSTGITEQEVSQWIDESFAMNNINVETTQTATLELTDTLKDFPDVSVESLFCGDGYCRVKLEKGTGEIPDISEFAGLPPFTGSGFTRPEEDGRLTYYFTERSLSLDDLKEKISIGE